MSKKNNDLRRVVMPVYHFLQEHYLTFRLLVCLKEIGITRRINFILSHKNDKNELMHPTTEMKEAKAFFEKNEVRVNNVVELLEDEISKNVYKACINYRINKKPIPSQMYMESNQYFVDEIFSIEENEVFIDGGAYTGDTIQQFIDVARKKKIKNYSVLAFEPSKKYYNLIARFFSKNTHVTVHKKGLSDVRKKVYFKENGATSKIALDKSDATEVIETISIDKEDECQNVTYIKLDIEGEELNALKGARNVIQRNKPKLAICIYHSNEDMIRIAEYINELVPDYKIFVRHHSRSDVETVLYAIVKDD